MTIVGVRPSDHCWGDVSIVGVVRSCDHWGGGGRSCDCLGRVSRIM